MTVRWSTDNEEVIELDPHYKDYSLYCGTQLDIRASSTTNIRFQTIRVDCRSRQPYDIPLVALGIVYLGVQTLLKGKGFSSSKDKTHRRQCKMSSSKKLTCKGTLRQTFIRLYQIDHCEGRNTVSAFPSPPQFPISLSRWSPIIRVQKSAHFVTGHVYSSIFMLCICGQILPKTASSTGPTKLEITGL